MVDLNIYNQSKLIINNSFTTHYILFLFSFKFKARPFDRRTIECDGMYGVKKPEETIAATKPKPFLFESDEGLVARKEKAPAENEVCLNFAIELKNFLVKQIFFIMMMKTFY